MGRRYCRLVFRTLSLFHCCLTPLGSLLANSGDFGRLNVRGVCCYSRTVIWGKGGAFLPGAYCPDGPACLAGEGVSSKAAVGGKKYQEPSL